MSKRTVIIYSKDFSMDSTHIHLLLNHFPIIGTFIGTLVLAWAVVRKSNDLRSAGCTIIILMALVAIPVYLTGEPAEESVEHLPGVSESMIESHEDAALQALIALEVAGVLALAGFFAHRTGHQRAHTLTLGALTVAIVSCALMSYTGFLGGQIRHSELRGAGQTESHSESEDH